MFRNSATISALKAALPLPRLFGVIGLTLLYAAWIIAGAFPTDAASSPSPCAGNVCTGSMIVGGQSVSYSYTQHISSNGQFRVRFNGGVYNTTNVVAFQISGLQPFASTGYAANPINGAQAMSDFDTNPTQTSYEVRDSDGCPSCIYDHVLWVQYSGLAAGTYSFSLSVMQNGSVGSVVALPYYVDAGAPANTNENSAWTVPSGTTYACADGIDNDIDFYADCADTQCVGAVGKVVTGALCQAAETTCNDSFDNDGDGLADCRDSDCDGRRGDVLTTAVCMYGNEYGAGRCGDSFDNDGDGLTDCDDNTYTAGNAANSCWKQAGCPVVETMCADGYDNDRDQSYSSSYDNLGTTGVDCQDYDCAGNIACPNKENYTTTGVNDDALCFDGLDNDLDAGFDCSDSDCAGAINPNNPSQGCYDNEFSLSQRYNYCSNGFDDDGNGSADCADSSCRGSFGNCGPCPSREDYTWASCADLSDNDADGLTNCADTQCHGKIGSTTLGAVCLAAESTNQACSDGFDNDNDGAIDCADPQCVGRTGPQGQTCQSVESNCSDGMDNDNDGLIDCADSSCAGVGSCAAASWTQAPACVTVPRYSGSTAFTSDNPTITGVVQLGAHVSGTSTIRFIGTASYSSVTFIAGDNTDAAAYYPYASPSCTLTNTSNGTPSTTFNFTHSEGRYVQVIDAGSGTVGAFDLTLTCPTPAIPAALKSYPISLSALKSPSNLPEYGDVDFSTTLYENVKPTITEVEGEGDVGGLNMSIPYSASGGSRRFRAVPTDPNPYSSGICKCTFYSGGATIGSSSSDCVSTPVSFTADASFPVSARAEDGSGNGSLGRCQNGTTVCSQDSDCAALPGVALCSGATATTFVVNVTPSNTTALTLGPSSPYFNGSHTAVSISGGFTTGTSDTFVPSCDLIVYREDGSGGMTVMGGFLPTLSSAVPAIAVANTITCAGSFSYTSISPALTDGRYFAQLRVRDIDGDYATSNLRTFYVCNTVPGPNDPEPTNGCQYADFDYDGAVEGLYTTKFSDSPKSCDNCVNLANASQADLNANGIGDICEPTEQYGRCEIDTEIVCRFDSDETPECDDPADPLCCPGPSIKDDPETGAPKNPQQCRDPWGACTSDGSICFTDSQCPGGKGLCQDGATACYRDIDCLGVEGTAACTGADICDNLLYPWIETKYGNVYSQKKILTADVPPKNLYNATFCVTAKETILNFKTEGLGSCAAMTDSSARPQLPQSSNQFNTVKGKLDLDGLRRGNYGQVVNVTAATVDNVLSSTYSNRLGGRVYYAKNVDLTINAHTLYSDTRGSGTIFVDGGNLTINGNLSYDMGSVDDLRKLPSLGIIVVDDGSGSKGNVYIGKDVNEVSAAIFSNGDGGFFTVAPPDTDSETQLTVYGLVVAKEFKLYRSFKSVTEGAERFIYDGRAVANPPPGFTDITKALPIFSSQ